ncbi:MAG: cytochrome c-type biogenesis protein CcmH, partial [Hyphomicrobiaceae bacterium]|nr:cytochrome c-type biogenesis protein CcmH [Hyphomicrobiaceae bacterium]
VLLKPRFAGKTILLWATPFAVLALAGLAVLLRSRGRRSAPEALTAEEEARLRDLLDEA